MDIGSYSAFAGFMQSASLILFVVLFGGVVIYALWPRNDSTFGHAARMPLDEDGPATTGSQGGRTHGVE